MFYKIIRRIFKILMAVLMPIKVIGKENFVQGKCIITCNHQTAMDIPCMIAHCPQDIYFMAKSQFFDKNKVIGYLFSKMHAFPVKTNSADINSLRYAIKILNEGKALGIFPQGTRIKTSPFIDRSRVFSGTAYLAYKTKSDIIPCMLKKPPKLFTKNTLFVGNPIRIDEFSGEMTPQEKLEKITDAFTERMNNLLTE